MTTAQFAWPHLIAAMALGLTAGWNLAIHVWNHQAKKARPKADPLNLGGRQDRLSAYATFSTPADAGLYQAKAVIREPRR